MQLRAFFVDQERADCPSVLTVVGLAAIVIVGAGTTVTVTLRVVEPVSPLQVRENLVVAASAGIDSVPATTFGPDHPPLAAQPVAPEADHVSDVAPLIAVEDGEAESDKLGAAAAGSAAFNRQNNASASPRWRTKDMDKPSEKALLLFLAQFSIHFDQAAGSAFPTHASTWDDGFCPAEAPSRNSSLEVETIVDFASPTVGSRQPLTRPPLD